MGKARQKWLPPGVEHAGRWWGRSRLLRVTPALEVVSRGWGEGERRTAEVRVVRAARKWLSRAVGRRIRGGVFCNWGGDVSGRLLGAMPGLLAFYGAQGRTADVEATKGELVNVGGGE